ncbi:MAG: ABC transporter ATP-binding protein [Candidatus Heimdallarchaeota archaeon]|nr:ABC transporter ATP-binding protein [Candidatus Heimdallarchaeota archaeon]
MIEIQDVHREFKTGDVVVHALNGVNLTINKGEFVVILGASGSGKTTLLNQLGGIDQPSSGTIVVGGVNVTDFDDRQMTEHRRATIGWVFQFHNLIPSLTCAENVQLALEMMGEKKNQRERAIAALEAVGLHEEIDRFPSQISGGQQQRVAVARALVKKPTIIVADEPTGNLDKPTGKMVVDVMQEINKKEGITFCVVTHDPSMAKIADRLLIMEDGKLLEGKGELERFLSGGD